MAKCTAERKGMFHTHNSVVDSDIEFVYKIYLSHEFDELRSYQQLNLIEEVLNEDCFESLIVKVVMLDDNAQKLNIVFLKMVIFLLADLQFEFDFHS